MYKELSIPLKLSLAEYAHADRLKADVMCRHSEEYAARILTGSLRVGREIQQFLGGTANPVYYEIDNWTASTNSEVVLPFPEIIDVLRSSTPRTISFGKPWYEPEQSYIPNVVGILQDAGIVAKIGHIEGLRSSAEALTGLNHPILLERGISTVASSVYHLAGTRMGMMVTNYVEGDPLQYQMWKNFGEVKDLLFASIQQWYNSYKLEYPDGGMGIGRTFIDWMGDGNAIRSSDGSLVIVDADMQLFQGKANSPNGWIAGDIAAQMYDVLLGMHMNPSMLGMKYYPDERKFYFS